MIEQVYPPQITAILERDGAHHYQVRTLEHHPGGCQNCGASAGDEGYFYLVRLKDGPFTAPPNKPNIAITKNGQGWWITESKSYPCPVCHAMDAALIGLNKCGLESHEWTLTMRSDYLPMEGKEAARDAGLQLVGQFPDVWGWLTLHGDYGRGKSHFMHCLVADAVRSGVGAHYYTAAEFLQSLTQSFGNPKVHIEQLLEKANQYKVLALDEIEKAPKGAWWMSVLFKFLDTRYRQGVPGKQHLTVLGMNIEPEKWDAETERLFGYLRSRMSGGTMLEVGGEDLRPLQPSLLEVPSG